MSNPDGLVNSQVPTPDVPMVPEEPVAPEPEEEEAGPANVATPADSDAKTRIAEHLAAREGEGSGELLYVGDTPAGGAGADSGGGGTVRVDPSSEASVPDESTHNDEPGVGTRRSRRERESRSS